MTTGREILLCDIRFALAKIIAEATDIDIADKCFAAWLLGWQYCPFDIPAITVSAVENRTGGYRDVAALGFLSQLTSPACSFRSELCEALAWLSSRPPTIVGTVAGFVSDPVGLLGVALGATRCGDPALEAAVGVWLESVCIARRALPEFEPWEVCILATAVRQLGRASLIPLPRTADAADCRVALRSLGVLPEVYPTESHIDETDFFARLVTEDVTGLGFVHTVVRASAYDSIKRNVVAAQCGGASSIERSIMSKTEDKTPPKTVFVSYSWEPEDADHQPRVLHFTQDLRRYGFKATMDLFEQHPPEGLPAWMLGQIRDSDYVLMVITETYRRRFESVEEPGKGKGVKWEGGIVTRSIFDTEFLNRKFIPIVFDKRHLSSMPIILIGSTYYDVTDAARFEELVRYMTDQPAYLPVPIGRTPVLPPRSV